jgi:hypothetical protein
VEVAGVSLCHERVQVRVGQEIGGGPDLRLTTGTAGFVVREDGTLAGEFLGDRIVGAVSGELIAFVRRLPRGGVHCFRGAHTMLLGAESDQIHVWTGTYDSPARRMGDDIEHVVAALPAGRPWSMVASGPCPCEPGGRSHG